MSRPGDFWSRRKEKVQAEEAAEAKAREAAQLAEEQAALEEKSDEELLAEFDLPDPDTLELGDDIKGFMNKAIPDRLRRRALRRLWRLNPVLANVDGLVDYGGDFTDSATVVENMQTAYQVGKGMLKHVEELARKAEEAANPPAPEPEDAEPEQAETAAPEPTAEEDPAPALQEQAPAETAQTQYDFEEEEAAPRRRRMRFHFDDTSGEHAA
ncbi:DUF3306 domain-containing protein [Primorskyibacter aestuariivivens]|uniref:DUF3306 domain-containing protein n=1 Tax=Primorskyibacter aestuariivivens TaxID=1888912 RepID=UPI0022FFCA14|nr:DUF3306 domain-containing protein [Primorskyibacter aestuariivivens]MDA7427884.1 DUF3306 domain-containing protein [Primorskyibacter aestuariivivens]